MIYISHCDMCAFRRVKKINPFHHDMFPITTRDIRTAMHWRDTDATLTRY